MIFDDDRLDAIFHALSNRTRRQLLADLSERSARVNELARPYDMSVNAISKHLFVLEKAGLVTRRHEGGAQACMLAPATLADADAWISRYRQYWTTQLQGFSRFVEEQKDDE